MCGPPAAAAGEVSRIEKDGWDEIDLTAQRAKCSGHIPAGPTATDRAAFAAAGIPLTDSVADAESDGVMATGTPVGSAQYVKATLDAAVAKLEQLAASVMELKTQALALGKQLAVPLQGLFAIVRLCLPSTFSHFMRTVYPSVVRPFAERVDEIVLKAALEACGLPALAAADARNAERRAVARRLFLVVPLGGMGVYSCAANVDAAFLGSAALTCETVRDLGVSPLDAGAAGTPYITELRNALARVQARLPNCDEVKGWTVESLLSKRQPRVQHIISAELAKVELAEIIAAFPDTEQGRQAQAEFAECGAPKAGAWVQARPLDYLSRFTNGEWWLSVARRLGVNPYPEVHPDCQCKGCHQRIGPDTVSHGAHCSKSRRRGICLRHTGLKNGLATCERKAEPGTHLVMEPFVMAALGGPDTMPPSHPDYARSRADFAVRTPGGASYVVDVTIVDATLGPKPSNSKYVVGKATNKAFDDKVAQYKLRFPRMDILSQFRAAAWDLRGGASDGTVDYLKEIAHREHMSNPNVSLSVVSSRLYQRVSVAIQRAIAYNAMEYRYWWVPVTVSQAYMAPVAAPALPVGVPGVGEGLMEDD